MEIQRTSRAHEIPFRNLFTIPGIKETLVGPAISSPATESEPRSGSLIKRERVAVNASARLAPAGFRLFMAIVALVVLVAAPGYADTFGQGPPDHGYEADSSAHTYCYGANFDTDLQDEADHAMNISIDRDTDMSDTFNASCTSEIDVRWRDANLSPGIRGQYQCTFPANPSPGDICFASDVTLDPAEINMGSNDPEDRLKTACHEAGHSVGLRHSSTANDCMLIGEIPNTTAQYRTYNTHHINDHINVEY